MSTCIDECCDQPGESEHLAQIQETLLDEATAERLAGIFKALADPTRVRIVSLLAQIELCVGDLAEALEMSMSAVSHQLRLLRALRLVKSRRDGKHVYYELDDEHIHTIFLCGLDHVLHE